MTDKPNLGLRDFAAYHTILSTLKRGQEMTLQDEIGLSYAVFVTLSVQSSGTQLLLASGELQLREVDEPSSDFYLPIPLSTIRRVDVQKGVTTKGDVLVLFICDESNVSSVITFSPSRPPSGSSLFASSAAPRQAAPTVAQWAQVLQRLSPQSLPSDRWETIMAKAGQVTGTLQQERDRAMPHVLHRKEKGANTKPTTFDTPPRSSSFQEQEQQQFRTPLSGSKADVSQLTCAKQLSPYGGAAAAVDTSSVSVDTSPSPALRMSDGHGAPATVSPHVRDARAHLAKAYDALEQRLADVQQLKQYLLQREGERASTLRHFTTQEIPSKTSNVEEEQGASAAVEDEVATHGLSCIAKDLGPSVRRTSDGQWHQGKEEEAEKRTVERSQEEVVVARPLVLAVKNDWTKAQQPLRPDSPKALRLGNLGDSLPSKDDATALRMFFEIHGRNDTSESGEEDGILMQ